MRERILAMLKESKDFGSGQELCEKFSVSRTAVWKAINALKEAGYEVEAVRNKGYRLVASPDVLLSDEIKSLLETKWFGRKILYFDSIDSTNNEIKRQAEKELIPGMLAIAEEQTAGRGRRERKWVSPPGTGIWMSFPVKPDLPPYKASMITLVTALAVARAVEEETGLAAGIKWPNDIVVNGRKITGILTEMSAEMTSIHYVVIGIGINANTKEFPEEIKETASSLFIESGKKVKRSRIVATFGKYFEKYYDMFCKAGNLSTIKPEYEERLVNKDKEVYIIDKEEKIRRTAVGIGDEGELIVKDDNGNEEKIIAGEVSVRGIYGYV